MKNILENMKKVYVLLNCDAWQSNESRVIISICTTKEKAFDFAVMDADNQKEPLTEEQKIELNENDQTQGRDINYIIEETILNAYFN